MSQTTSISEIRSSAQRHLDHFTNLAGDRAFNTYDRQGDPSRLEPLDCLAPTLLSIRITNKQVIPLFKPDGPGKIVLAAMQAVLDYPAGESLDFVDPTFDLNARPWLLVDEALVAAGEADDVGIPGLKAVAVTKILHRKRPTWVPIFDSQVYSFYTGERAPIGAYKEAPRRLWPMLQIDLRTNQDWIRSLAAQITTPDGRPLSLLRAADIIVWEHQVTKCSGDSTSVST